MPNDIINTYVNSSNAGSAGGTVSVTVPDVAVDDQLIIAVGCVYTPTSKALTPTTTGEGTLAAATARVGDSGVFANYSLQTFRKVATASGTHTVTSPALDHPSLIVMHVRAAAALETSVFAAHVVQSQSNNQVNAGPITTTEDNVLLVGVFGLVHFSGSQTWPTIPAGMAQRGVAGTPDGTGQLMMAAGVQAAAGGSGTKTAGNSTPGAVYGEAGNLIGIKGAAAPPAAAQEPGRMLLGNIGM